MAMIITGILLLAVCQALTITEQIYPVEHEDGHCMVPAPNAIKLSHKFICQFEIHAFMSKTIYVPTASAMFYQAAYVLVNGNSTKSSELSKVCLTTQHEPPHFQIIFAGGNSYKFICEVDSEGVFHCKKMISRLTPTWTNYKDVLVVVGCLTTGKRTWGALSKHQNLSADVVESIQGHIYEAHVFNETKTVTADYKSC